MKRLAALVALLAVFFVARTAAAHKPSDSYLTLTVERTAVHGRWDIAIRDLAYAIDVDRDGDGKITWGELHAQERALAEYALARLDLTAGGPCALHATKSAIASHSDGNYAVLYFEAACPAEVRTLGVGYRLFFDLDRQHRGLLRLEGPGSRAHVFTATASTISFDLERADGARQLWTLAHEGVIHIWTGYDHVLFLLALLLPSVLRRDGRGWIPIDRLSTAIVDVLRIVTAFTLAHSMTLSVAALGIVTLPSRLVESAIALSVILAALNNVRPILREDRWAAAFLLGLMHGFGFSATLMDLELPRYNLILTLFGFNLGVEVGQIAIVAVFVPLAYAVRKTELYRRGVLVAGSLAILALASAWLVERALLVKILP